MNESAKEQFKWKFWHLAVILNGIILFTAVAIIFLLLGFLPYRLPVIIISAVIVLSLAFIFARQYRKTKAWLEIHGTSPEQSEN